MCKEERRTLRCGVVHIHDLWRFRNRDLNRLSDVIFPLSQAPSSTPRAPCPRSPGRLSYQPILTWTTGTLRGRSSVGVWKSAGYSTLFLLSPSV